MRKIVLRVLAGLLGGFLGFIAYSEYTTPVLSGNERALFMVTNTVLCVVLLYYAMTGNRKPFFPKWVPLFPKKKRK